MIEGSSSNVILFFLLNLMIIFSVGDEIKLK